MPQPLFATEAPVVARPFVKWAGVKGQLIGELSQRLPRPFGRYHEPFLGGAALFFHLYNNRLLRRGATLTDYNRELLGCYQVIRDDVESLIAALALHERHRLDREYFLEVRDWDRRPGFD